VALDLGTRTDEGAWPTRALIDGVKWISTDDCGFLFGQYANCYGCALDVERYYPNYRLTRARVSLHAGRRCAPRPRRQGGRPGNHTTRCASVTRPVPSPSFQPLRHPRLFTCANNTPVASIFGFIDSPTSYDFIKGTSLPGMALSEVTQSRVSRS